jgi:hypothetical protein
MSNEFYFILNDLDPFVGDCRMLKPISQSD